MINRLTSLSNNSKKLVQILTDSTAVIVILLLSFSIRLGVWYFPGSDLLWLIFGSPIFAIPIFWRFSLYRSVIRFIGFKSLWQVVQAVSLYALVWGIFGFMASLDGIPRSVILINWILSILIICGLRVIAHWLLNRENLLKINSSDGTNRKVTLVYGAGEVGMQLVLALKHSSEYLPIGFIDDSIELYGRQIQGLEVYSLIQITDLIDKYKVDEILIAQPPTSRAKRRVLLDKLELFPVLVRILPGLTELAEGKVNISDLREVDIKDLLGRDSVKPQEELLSKNINDKVVLVTGAGGSIGAELCRQVIILEPTCLILYEMNELALYNIEKELSKINTNLIDIYPVLGSVNNKNRLIKVFKRFRVNTVYHAAAYKHVPMVEFNNTEGVENNIFGTLYCAQAAIQEGVETFLLISTDKAVRPTNTMGATKRIAELILQALSSKNFGIKFTIVRFGNVLGSSGSVIPLFKKQIKDGGPLTVTDKNIYRYFMTIQEAVELVIQSGAMRTGGDVFVLDMGEPVLISDLAKKMIRLSGLNVKDEFNPEGDIEIKFTGLRPGEKLYEELLIGSNVSDTDNPLIMRAKEEMMLWEDLEPILLDLKDSVQKCDYELIRRLLVKTVPDFKPQIGITDVLYETPKSFRK